MNNNNNKFLIESSTPEATKTKTVFGDQFLAKLSNPVADAMVKKNIPCLEPFYHDVCCYISGNVQENQFSLPKH